MRQGWKLALMMVVVNLAFASSVTAAEFEKYAVETVSASLSSTQAGAHADLTTTFKLTQTGQDPYAQTQDIDVTLPPGVIGNPQTIPRCTVAQLSDLVENSKCPQDSQVGVTEITLGGVFSGTFLEPIYNMEAPDSGDIVARLGLFAGPYPALINARVNPIDYRLTASIEGVSSA